MSIETQMNRTFREFRRYTGDGLPGEPGSAPLPIGDPASGTHSPSKAELRSAFAAAGQTLDTVVGDTEAARDLAIAAQLAAESAAGANLANADSRAAVEATNIPAPVQYIRTAGYAVAGDGGGSLYRRAASEPSHAGKVQSADGAWWEDTFHSTESVLVPSDFSTLQEAIDLLSRQPVRNGAVIELVIETGHALTDGVLVENGDFGRFHIVSQSGTVALASGFPAGKAVVRGINARLPVLACLINAGGLGGDGYAVETGSVGLVEASCGVINAGGRGCYVHSGSSCVARNANFSGSADRALWVTRGSQFDGEGFNGSNSGGDRACYFSRGSTGTLDGANFSNFTGTEAAVQANRSILTCIHLNARFAVNADGIRSSNGSVVTANGADVRDCKVALRAERGSTLDATSALTGNFSDRRIAIDDGGFVTARGVPMTGLGLVSVPNVLSRRGAIFSDSANGEVERGSNANGTWIKYADGTIIMWRNVEVNLSTTNSQVFSMPQAVVAGPLSVNGNAEGDPGSAASGNGNALAVSYVSASGTGAAPSWTFRCNGAGSTTNRPFTLAAIGRWH